MHKCKTCSHRLTDASTPGAPREDVLCQPSLSSDAAEVLRSGLYSPLVEPVRMTPGAPRDGVLCQPSLSSDAAETGL